METQRLTSFCKRITVDNGEKPSYIRVRIGNNSRTARSASQGIPVLGRSASEVERHIREVLENNRGSGKKAWVEWVLEGETNRSEGVCLDVVSEDEEDIDPSNTSAVLVHALVSNLKGIQQLFLNEREHTARLSQTLVENATAQGYVTAQLELAEESDNGSGMQEMAAQVMPLITQVVAHRMAQQSAGAGDQGEEVSPKQLALVSIGRLTQLLGRPDAAELLADSEVEEALTILFGVYASVSGLQT